MVTGRFERGQLSMQGRLRRSLYDVLRDELGGILIQHGLIASYWNFRRGKAPYPFVQKRELKPRARGGTKEFSNQNNFLVVFCEGVIPNEQKKHIRFFETNRVKKSNIDEFTTSRLYPDYTPNHRYFDNPGFRHLLVHLLPEDYALLIQQDASIKRRHRYLLSHFHVKIDWPIDDATEAMARDLHYIRKRLYERGDQHALHLNQKLFEKYGFHHTAGGRRTASVVARQLLEKMDFVSTVYVSSSEARTLTSLSERGISRFALCRFTMDEMARLTHQNGMTRSDFETNFLIDKHEGHGVGILQVLYGNTEHGKATGDTAVRDFQPEYKWLTVRGEFLLPLPGALNAHPVPYRTIYGGH